MIAAKTANSQKWAKWPNSPKSRTNDKLRGESIGDAMVLRWARSVQTRIRKKMISNTYTLTVSLGLSGLQTGLDKKSYFDKHCTRFNAYSLVKKVIFWRTNKLISERTYQEKKDTNKISPWHIRVDHSPANTRLSTIFRISFVLT